MHIVSTTITSFVAAVCFAVFSWGVKKHFRSTGAMPLGMKLISLLSLALFAAFAWHIAQGTSGLWLVALGLFIASLAVFAAAVAASHRTPPTLAFDTDAPNFLLQHGPYRYVRHPFYLAYVLFWLGTAVAVPGALGWAAPLVMTALYIEAAAREERKFANSDLAGAYQAYRARAGMFWPRPLALLIG
ncbi:MAG: isoprenylcysteine carboxylmethyltransferase family protein [Rhodospirillales bacterium]|nr:isoprenylcysteine carboxylmethyltransferase family protein [Rhodospirillales bacterium]MDE2459047.1 isoprenylcysteine carboxylmethyltransferase family protein [Rhodospirillales bacterium]